MRRVVYHTECGNRTPHLEHAQEVGLKSIALLKIENKPALPANRDVARYNLKYGIVLN